MGIQLICGPTTHRKRTIMQTTKNTFVPRLLTALVLSGAAVLLAGCASPSYPITDAARVSAGKEALTPPTAGDFPDITSAKWQQGAYPSLEALRSMNTGMGKDQVRELLSWPHFSEGLGGAREWNYIFHFRTGKGAETVTCQYMVRFNKDVLTTGMYWKNPECGLLVNPPTVRAIPAAVINAPTPPSQKVTLGADGLFSFGGSELADLMPAGKQKVEVLAAEIKRNFKSLNYILVTWHTDRLGTDARNEPLSLARANTVRDLLVQQGIDRKAIRIAGMGKRQPMVDCPGTQATPQLVSCLQPNRRVDIEVSSQN